jgi:CRP-like cAMP-binding protein
VTPSRQEFAARFPHLAEHCRHEDLAAILDQMTLRKLSPGERLIEEGAVSDRVYFLLDGTLVVTLSLARGSAEAGTFGPGTIFGEVALLDPGPATATVAAAGPATVLGLARAAVDELRVAHPRAASSVLHALAFVLTERIRRASDWLGQLRGHAPAPRTTLLDAFRALLGLPS